jgi:hypothetical protein
MTRRPTHRVHTALTNPRNSSFCHAGYGRESPAGSPEVCPLNLVGTSVLQDGSTGLVRLSKNADSSGNGPSSPKYLTGPGSGCE